MKVALRGFALAGSGCCRLPGPGGADLTSPTTARAVPVGDWSSGTGGVLGNVMLPGESGNALHQLVGEDPGCVAAALVSLCCRMERSADGDRAPPARARQARAWRLDRIGPDDADRKDWAGSGRREACRACVPTMEVTIARPGSFRVDAQQTAAAQHVRGCVETDQRSRSTVSVDWDHAQRREQSAGLPRLEVVRLADEMDGSLERHHHQHRVEEAEMVRAEDGGAFSGHGVEPGRATRP